MGTALDERLLSNFLAGTLPDAVEVLARDAGDPVAQSCLHEAADKLRAARLLFEGAIDTVEALRLLRIGLLDNRHAIEVIDAHVNELEYALAKARGES